MKTTITTRANEHTGKHLTQRLPRSLSGKCGLVDKRGSKFCFADHNLRSRHGISSIQYFNNGSLHVVEQNVGKAPFLVHAANEQSLALQNSDQLGIQDTWDVLTDLWSRLCAICTVTVTPLQDGYEWQQFAVFLPSPLAGEGLGERGRGGKGERVPNHR